MLNIDYFSYPCRFLPPENAIYIVELKTTMNDGRTKYEHFDGLIERNNALIERMCILRASGDGRRCDELRQECYIMIWKHEKQIGTDISPRQEALWVYWTCRSAFSRLRLLRRAHLYVALDDTLADTLAAHDGTDPLGDYIETLSAILTPPRTPCRRTDGPRSHARRDGPRTGHQAAQRGTTAPSRHSQT